MKTIDELLRWVQNNEIACYYFFEELKHDDRLLDIEKEAFSNKERYSNIKKIASSDLSPRGLENISKYIKEKHDKWNRLKEENKWTDNNKKYRLMDWFKGKNKADVRWIVDYFDKNEIMLKEKLDETWINFDYNELYLNIIYRFIMWDVHTDTKRIFLEKIKKSWSQKKYRHKVENKKVLNIYLESDVKYLLKRAARLRKVTITELVSTMIQECFADDRQYGKRVVLGKSDHLLDNPISRHPKLK